jgi:hypothetical protein
VVPLSENSYTQINSLSRGVVVSSLDKQRLNL